MKEEVLSFLNHNGVDMKRVLNGFLKKSVCAIGVLAVLAQMSGCTTPVVAAPKYEPDPQLTSLNKVAEQVSAQLDRLIRLERNLPEAGVEQAAAVSPLKTSVYVQWGGSGEELAEGLAKKIGYRFSKSGVAPLTPIIVPLDGQSRTVETVLRIVADRMVNVAEIRVSEKQKWIEVAYKK
jgi:DotD protein